MKAGKEYFAFISYSHQDEKWARWLAHELDSYKLPSTLNGKELPASLRKTFRDVEELRSGNLRQQIHDALDKADNLIVVCSPHSAKSKWVDEEIQDFIKTKSGKSDKVFPFIVEGIPFSKEPEKECFPESLRTLPENEERLGGNINEQGGRNAAVVKVVAGMLGVSFDSLWNKYEREERHRRHRILAGVLALAIIAFGVAGWLWNLNTQLTNKNRQLSIENIKVGSREVVSLLNHGNYVEAINELQSLTALWHEDFRNDVPEFEQALRTMYRYEQTDGISKLYSIPLSNNQRYLCSDSSYFYISESKEWQDEILRYDIGSGEFIGKVFPTQTQRDTAMVMQMSGQKVLYSTSHNAFQDVSLRLYDMESGNDMLLLEHGGNAWMLSDDDILVNHRIQDVNQQKEAELITVKNGQVASRSTIPLPFFPQKAALKGDSLIIAYGSRVATWHTKQRRWFNQMTYRPENESRFIAQQVLDLNPESHWMANMRYDYGLVLYGTDRCDSMVINSKIEQASVAFNPSGTLMAVADTNSDSLVVYSTDNMVPLFRLSSVYLDGVEIAFVNENTIVATQSRYSFSAYHLSMFSVEAHFNTCLLYAPDGSHHLETPDQGKTLEIVVDSTDECVLRITDVNQWFRVFGFSPHGRYLKISTSENQYALLDFRKPEAIPIVSTTDPRVSFKFYQEAFSDDESTVAILWKGNYYDMSDTLKIYDVAKGTMRDYVTGMKLLNIAISYDGSQLAMTDGSSIRLLQIDSLSIKPREYPSPVPTFSTNNQSVHDFCFTPDGQHLVVSYSDGTLRQWSIESGQPSSPTMRSDEALLFGRINVSPDGQYLIGTAELKNEKWEHDVWHLATGQRVDRLTDEWSWFLKPYISTYYYLPGYEACFSRDGSPNIIINERQLLGLSRIFSFPAFEDLIKMYSQ